MKKTKFLRAACLCFAVIFIFLAMPLSASAISNIDNTGVYKDLQTMGVDLSLYKPSDELDSPKIMQFLEYAFDQNGNQSDFGIYLYVYNPSKDSVVTGSQFNTVQIVTKSSMGTVTSNKKYKLKFISSSTDDDGEGLGGLYYKFKVDTDSLFLTNLSGDKRVYDVVDLELQYNEPNPRKSNISATYVCTGFQPNHWRDPDTGKLMETSSFYCQVVELDTIEIDLHPATWKTTSSDKGSHYQYEVSSVYFSIPDYYLEKYGDMADEDFKGLAAVDGVWYEYKINGIVSDSEELVNTAQNYLGVSIKDNSMTEKRLMGPFASDAYLLSSFCSGTFNRCYYSNTVPFGFAFLDGNTLTSSLFYFNRLYAVNLAGFDKIHLLNSSNNSFGDRVNRIPGITNVFYSDFSKAPLLVSTEDLMNSIFGSSSGPYFLDRVDEGRKIGLNEYHIEVEDASLNGKIAAYATKDTKIGNWLSGKGWIDKSEDAPGYDDIRPIVMLDPSDVSGSREDISKDLFVCEEDVKALSSYVNRQDGRTTYLMRFAVTDYYCAEINVTSNDGAKYSGTHYYFEKTIFHNFDVLSFTFKNEFGKYTTVPVSSRPITIVGNVTMNPSDVTTVIPTWLKLLILIFGVAVIVLVVVFLYSYLNKRGGKKNGARKYNPKPKKARRSGKSSYYRRRKGGGSKR